MTWWSLRATAPSGGGSFSIPVEGPGNLHWPLGDLSRQAPREMRGRPGLGDGAVCPWRAELCREVSGPSALRGAPSVTSLSWVSAGSPSPHLSSLTPAPPWWPWSRVICCFFKRAPHPCTGCQEGPLFMRIPRWLQLTLRCTVLGLCPEFLLVFFRAPLLLTYSGRLWTQPSRQACFCCPESFERSEGCGGAALQGNLRWPPEPAWGSSVPWARRGEEAGRLR